MGDPSRERALEALGRDVFDLLVDAGDFDVATAATASLSGPW